MRWGIHTNPTGQVWLARLLLADHALAEHHSPLKEGGPDISF